MLLCQNGTSHDSFVPLLWKHPGYVTDTYITEVLEIHRLWDSMSKITHTTVFVSLAADMIIFVHKLVGNF